MKLLCAGSEFHSQLCPLDTATILSHVLINDDTFAKHLSTRGYKEDAKAAQITVKEDTASLCLTNFVSLLFSLTQSCPSVSACLSLSISLYRSLLLVNYRSLIGEVDSVLCVIIARSSEAASHRAPSENPPHCNSIKLST